MPAEHKFSPMELYAQSCPGKDPTRVLTGLNLLMNLGNWHEVVLSLLLS